MARIITSPLKIKAAGTVEKLIEEYIGIANSGTGEVSIAMMNSPSGWSEPGQTPEFDEYSIVLSGVLRVNCGENEYNVTAGQCVIARKNEWVQYSTPDKDGARYVSVCVPAFSPETVHRDGQDPRQQG